MAAPGSMEPSALPEGGFAIRRRIVALVVLQFVVLVGMFAVLGLWPDGSGTRVLVVLLLALVTLSLPFVLALMAAPIVSRVEALEQQHADLLQMYGRARSDALLDGLTSSATTAPSRKSWRASSSTRNGSARRCACSLSTSTTSSASTTSAATPRATRCSWQLDAWPLTHVRRSDRAFRVGGDEFAILLPQATVDDGLVIARRMLAGAVSGGVPGQPIAPFSLSIGVSAYPAPTTEKHLLYRHADAALYWGKRHGRTTVVGYDPGGTAPRSTNGPCRRSPPQSWRSSTSAALRPAYQPIFSLASGDVVGFEGLVGPSMHRASRTRRRCSPARRARIGPWSSTWPAWPRSRAGSGRFRSRPT